MGLHQKPAAAPTKKLTAGYSRTIKSQSTIIMTQNFFTNLAIVVVSLWVIGGVVNSRLIMDPGSPQSEEVRA